MKKYYIIAAATAAALIFCLVVLGLNPKPSAYIPRDYFSDTTPTVAGMIAAEIAGIVIILLIIIRLVYVSFKYIRKLVLKIQGKKDTGDYTSDAAELYTTKQSAKDISDWAISTTRGWTDKENNSGKK